MLLNFLEQSGIIIPIHHLGKGFTVLIDKNNKILVYIMKAICTFVLLISFMCFFSARWYIRIYGDLGFDSIVFTLQTLGGVQGGLVKEFCAGAALPAIVSTGAASVILFLQTPKQLKLGKVQIYPLSLPVALVFTVVISIISIISAADTVGLPRYLYNKMNDSKIFEEEYVDPATTTITFPEEKRNLVFIFLESMEVTFFSKEEGGAEDVNLIPELYSLAEENVSFSHNEGIGGFRCVGGTSWTIGAMVGQSAGIPLKTPDNVEHWQNGYGQEGVFLPGVTALSDILHENGYYQSLMVGSKSAFGGRSTYYSTHNVDTIYDIYSAREDGIVPKDYYVWWGMEDLYLFEYAKQELTEISAQEQPFAFTMLTVDTHHIDGYVCEYCEDIYDEQYENVMACSSRQVLEFVEWIQQQDFYENTTIVICGDHPSMDSEYFWRNIDPNYTRRVYNCFINAAVETDYEKNRDFTTLDIFPTTLAAMGCIIEGERLGLGVNMFSGEKTLAEEMGYDQFNSQVDMASDYYATHFRNE